MFNDDPIKSYGKSKVSKIFGEEDLSGGIENKYEYDDNENLEDNYQPAFFVTKYGINRTRGLSIQTVFVSFILIWIALCSYALYTYTQDLNELNQESQNAIAAMEENEMTQAQKQNEIKNAEERLNQYEFNELKQIVFEDGASIPTIYNSVDKVKKVKEQKYRYLDKRFGDGITTIEIIYEEPFTENEIDSYIFDLISENYMVTKMSYLNEYTFVKEIVGTDKFLMVIIEDDRLVYGAGVGNSAEYTRENKNIK